MGLPRWLGGGSTKPRTPATLLDPDVYSGPPGTNPNAPNMPEGVSANELYAWRRNRTQAGRETLLGNATQRAFENHAALAAERLAATNPPPTAEEAESEATKKAKQTAMRVRRRGMAGNAGRVTTGTGATPGVGAGGSPRSLIGY